MKVSRICRILNSSCEGHRRIDPSSNFLAVRPSPGRPAPAYSSRARMISTLALGRVSDHIPRPCDHGRGLDPCPGPGPDNLLGLDPIPHPHDRDHVHHSPISAEAILTSSSKVQNVPVRSSSRRTCPPSRPCVLV